MGLSKFQNDLAKYHKASFDTMVLIYALEQNEQYLPLVRAILQNAENGTIAYYVSLFLYLEVMAGFYKKEIDYEIEKAKQFFVQFPSIHYIDVNRTIADAAAKLRATHDFKTPDAIIAATAIVHTVDVFITNDIQFKKQLNTTLPVLYLGDYVA